MGLQDVLNTIESFPRTPADAGIIPIIPVNLKRKFEYKTTYLAQLIDTNKIYEFLEYLCKMVHPSYKFSDDWRSYNKRFLAEDPIGAKLVSPEAEAEIVEVEAYISELKDKEVDKSGSERIEKGSDNAEIEMGDEEIEEEKMRMNISRKIL